VNYKDHTQEAAMDLPKVPMVFTKFPSCLAGPTADIPLTSNRVDWEAELVVVIGRGGQRIAAKDAFEYVAGRTGRREIFDMLGFSAVFDLADDVPDATRRYAGGPRKEA
jgi:hypothetical protein